VLGSRISEQEPRPAIIVLRSRDSGRRPSFGKSTVALACFRPRVYVELRRWVLRTNAGEPRRSIRDVQHRATDGQVQGAADGESAEFSMRAHGFLVMRPDETRALGDAVAAEPVRRFRSELVEHEPDAMLGRDIDVKIPSGGLTWMQMVQDVRLRIVPGVKCVP